MLDRYKDREHYFLRGANTSSCLVSDNQQQFLCKDNAKLSLYHFEKKKTTKTSGLGFEILVHIIFLTNGRDNKQVL